MVDKPNLVRSMQIPPIKMHRYERYLPTAFDESMTILEKINKVIHYLYEYSQVTEQMLDSWNEVYRWVLGEGLDNSIGDRLREWLEDGTFERIINEEIFNELNVKVDGVIDEVNNMRDDFNVIKNDFIDEINTIINNFQKEYGVLKQDFYMLGETTIYRGE